MTAQSLKEPRDKNANVTVYQEEWKWGEKKLQGRVADRAHTSGCAEQHNTHARIYSVCISVGDETLAYKLAQYDVCHDAAR